MDNVLEFGYEFVTLCTMEHQLGACVRLVARLDKLYTLFWPHVLIQHGQDIYTELCRGSRRDLHIEEHLPRESFDMGLPIVFLN